MPHIIQSHNIHVPVVYIIIVPQMLIDIHAYVHTYIQSCIVYMTSNSDKRTVMVYIPTDM